MTPSFCGVTFCNKCSVGPSDVVSLSSWAGCSREVCCGWCGPSFIVWSWLLLSCLYGSLALRPADCEAQPWAWPARCCADVKVLLFFFLHSVSSFRHPTCLLPNDCQFLIQVYRRQSTTPVGIALPVVGSGGYMLLPPFCHDPIWKSKH